jgi:acyl-coenzyme A synthetase/AMP-(fatty) acid ligase/4-hydroxybenzoate polyprenyltransferase
VNCLENYLKTPHVKSDKPAIIFFKGLHSLQKAKSFKELYIDAVNAQKYLKKQSFKKGDSLLLFEEPSPGLYAFILASIGLGVKLLIVEPWMKGDAINSVLKKISPKGIMTTPLGSLVLSRAKESKKIPHKFNSKVLKKMANKNEELEVIPMNANDHAILTFTSGTSGQPKGVHRKHQYLIDQASVLRQYLPYETYDKLDLTVFTNIVLLNLTLGKGSLVIPSSWKKSTLKQLDQLPEEFAVDTTACGPTFLTRLMDATATLDLKAFHIGGALADNKTYKRALERWPNAQFHHVYGSTEAEPVCVSDLKMAITESEKAGFFQTLYIGEPIKEIILDAQAETTWVSGVHVSPMYENDEQANKKNKKLDHNGNVWHNMGDRLDKRESGYFYQGRDFQTKEEFEIEQGVYNILGHSNAFIHNENGKLILFGEDVSKKSDFLQEKYPQITRCIDRKIIRDVRHKARIDRSKSLSDGVSMSNILQFIKERVPIIANLILAFGLVFSTQALLEHKFSILELVLSLISLLIFITELRFMDEIKDYEKDKVAHPDRPLPRGLVTVKQVQKLMVIFFGLFLACGALSYYYINATSGKLLFLTALWLFLMYKEFFIPKLINKSPIVYAISHQVIILPIVFYLTTIINYSLVFSPTNVGLALIVLSSFFTFEVGRKMDPKSDPILGTYLIQYGKVKTNLLILVLMLPGLFGGLLIGKFLWMAIPAALIFITQIRIFINQDKFKDLEGIIALNLIYNMWFILISEVIK